MFKKLLSNLPFNPSLIARVSCYGRRLRKESATRRAGFILIALTMLIQFFAVVSPPQASLASSDNDLVKGGIFSKEGALYACQTNTRDYQTILADYGISCDDIGQTQQVTLRSTDYSKQLFALGHNQYGTDNETPVTINNQTLWLRYLWSWDGPNASSYQALKGTSKSGLQYFILNNSGNLVFMGIPPHATNTSLMQPSKPASAVCPEKASFQPLESQTSCLEFHKTAANITQNIVNANGTTAHADDVIRYTLTVKNMALSTIKYTMTDNFSDVLDYADITDLHGGTLDHNNNVVWPKTDLKAGQSLQKQITVKIKNPIPSTPVSASDPGHFDLKMTNVYTDTVNIKLPPAVSKQVESAARGLPNISVGPSLMIGLVMTICIAYFFARTKLFAVELALVREDFSHGGGR